MKKCNFQNCYMQVDDRLTEYEQQFGSLAGVAFSEQRDVLIKQIISSTRRIDYIREIQNRPIHPNRCNPHGPSFDPLKASILHRKNKDFDEAVWLVFLFTHFGRHNIDGWQLIRNIYGTFGSGPIWTFKEFSNSPNDFLKSMKSHIKLLNDPNQSGRFSNHRKYESRKPEHITRVLQSFCELMLSHGGLKGLLNSIHKRNGQSPTLTFDEMYKEFNQVQRFGRLAKFDFLSMIGLGKLELIPIEPFSTYLCESTGPKKGAELLFFGNKDVYLSCKDLESKTDELAKYLGVGMQIMEDALCNWQKSPNEYLYFR